jgi:acetyltransferase-like isoleucine patch superfamily enzyme
MPGESGSEPKAAEKLLAAHGFQVASAAMLGKLAIFEAPAAIDLALPVTSLQIGAFSFIGARSEVNEAKIGRFTSIAPRVVIGPSEHQADWLSTHPMFCGGVMSYFEASADYRRWFVGDTIPAPPVPVSIGSDVWIGHGAFIRTGVQIGDGAIIGARSVVTRDVEPYTVVAGSPARPIRRRFDERTIERLLRLRWWTYDLSQIKGQIDFSDPVAALDVLEALIAAKTLPRFQPKRFRVERVDDGRQIKVVEELPSVAI